MAVLTRRSIDKWTQQLESMRVKMSAKRARVGSRADDGVE